MFLDKLLATFDRMLSVLLDCLAILCDFGICARCKVTESLKGLVQRLGRHIASNGNDLLRFRLNGDILLAKLRINQGSAHAPLGRYQTALTSA